MRDLGRSPGSKRADIVLAAGVVLTIVLAAVGLAVRRPTLPAPQTVTVSVSAPAQAGTTSSATAPSPSLREGTAVGRRTGPPAEVQALLPKAERRELPTATPTLRPTSIATSAPTETPSPTATPASTGSASLPYFAVCIDKVDTGRGLELAKEAGVGAVKHGVIPWSLVEPVRTEPPTYHWEKLAALDQEIAAIHAGGFPEVLTIMYTPEWAQSLPGHSCGPVKPEALAGFAQFLQAAVQRYSQSPFGVKFWEMFNESDTDPALTPPNGGVSCWADPNDPFYGGRTYGEMLKVAYPAIKEADPEAQVVAGSLMLDTPDAPHSAFLSGILEAGAGPYFDILAVHAYSYFYTGVYDPDLLPQMPWAKAGGAFAGKVAFVRQVMQQYGYDKPIFVNEVGLAWMPQSPPPDDYRLAQADHVARLYARGRALGVASVAWYGWQEPGWRGMALLSAELSPTPAYAAYAFTAQELSGAVYTGVTDYAGIEGYTFDRGETKIVVVWSADGTEQPVSVVSTQLQAAYDVTGQPLSPQDAEGQATFTVLHPIYLELAP